MSIRFGLGTGDFTSAVSTAYGCGPSFVRAADMNGDTKEDLVIVNTSNNNASVSLNVSR